MVLIEPFMEFIVVLSICARVVAARLLVGTHKLVWIGWVAGIVI